LPPAPASAILTAPDIMLSAALDYHRAMRRADRLLRLVQILRRARGPVTAARIADELEITVRTVYRDMASLIGNGVPVIGEAGVGYVLGEGFDLPPLMFNPDELEALMLGARLVEARGDPALSLAAADAVTKIAAVLPKSLRPVLLEAPLMSTRYREPLLDHIDAALIRTALREQRKLAIAYVDEKGETTERIVWPVVLGYLEDRRILVAWCELRSDYRHFRTDRIAAASILADRLPKHRDSLLKRWRELEASHSAERMGAKSRV
jgi:predicted DNA-binding transcriptional regulator YafY